MAAARPRRTSVVRGAAGKGGSGIEPIVTSGPAEAGPDGLLAELRTDRDAEGGDALTQYLREIRRTDLFTPDEEYRTACAARQG
ncbi:MAG: sigma-70 factor domain-containing protein, partial [Pseudoxanthomonas sp.]